ncbi:MAG: hypothetical protein RLZZ69_2782 [Cyanobacteriota bacterium]|jgi:hypothetical protein
MKNSVQSRLLQSIWSTVTQEKRAAISEGFKLLQDLAEEGIFGLDDQEKEDLLYFMRGIRYYYNKVLIFDKAFDLPWEQAGIINYFAAICGNIYALGIVSYDKEDVDWSSNIADVQKVMLTKSTKRSARSANLECVYQNVPVDEIPAYVVDVIMDAFVVVI